jgi:ketosteroid isomerase-like protein
MHPNAALLTAFYTAFAAGDSETMAASYADDATFSDPIFPELDAEHTRAMWRMFCTSKAAPKVTFHSVQADDASASACWEAVYNFPKTGRPVHNKVQATFELRDGLIVRHRDDFDLYRWTRMALGPLGTVLGWTPILQNQVRAQSAALLRRFRAA